MGSETGVQTFKTLVCFFSTPSQVVRPCLVDRLHPRGNSEHEVIAVPLYLIVSEFSHNIMTEPDPISDTGQQQNDCSSSSQPLSPLPAFLLAASAAAVAAALSYYLRSRRRVLLPPKNAPSAICALARAWNAQDPDPQTRAEVSAWLSRYLTTPDVEELRSLPDALDPSKRLHFGTAGIRAVVGAGYDRLNVLTLIAIAQATCIVSNPRDQTVVVGHDARLDSRKFAVVVADVFHQYGAKVLLFSRPVPTPFVAYAVREMNCRVGLCVTASHNPAKENGLKVFWEDGIQIRSGIADQIERSVKDASHPWKSYALTDAELGDVDDPFDYIANSYYYQITNTLLNQSLDVNASSAPVVYTACHGVGTPYIQEMFSHFGLPAPILCPQQCDPDPSFPTLPFPNPEEKGALDLAIRTAKHHGASLILANDPDADRLGAAEVGSDGAVRVFTGDEIALLLADYLSSGMQESQLVDCALVTSTVSSKVLASMARKRGFLFKESLTGFKWLNKEAANLEEDGKLVLLTYEEAIGFNVTRNIVRDKDGISAAAVFAEMSGVVHRTGKTLAGKIDDLLDECGMHMSYNGHLRLSGASPNTKDIFERARQSGFPDKFDKAAVKSVRDLTYGTDTAEPDGISRLPGDFNAQFLTFRCAGRDRTSESSSVIIHLRGSGTGKNLIRTTLFLPPSGLVKLIANAYTYSSFSCSNGRRRTENQILCGIAMLSRRSRRWLGETVP